MGDGDFVAVVGVVFFIEKVDVTQICTGYVRLRLVWLRVVMFGNFTLG